MILSEDTVRAVVRGLLPTATVSFAPGVVTISLDDGYKAGIQYHTLDTDWVPALDVACDTLRTYVDWRAGKLKSPRERYAEQLRILTAADSQRGN